MIESFGRRMNHIETLVSISIKIILDNLPLYIKDDVKMLEILPFQLKNIILKRFTSSSYFWRNIDFKTVLSAVVNVYTSQIDLTSVVVDDEMLGILTNSKNLTKIYLSRSNGNLMTTTGLTNLLRHTKDLYIFLAANCDKIDDTVLECLSNCCPNLMGLDIRGCKNVTDCGVKYLSKLRNLVWLTFSNTQVSDDGLVCLAEGPSGENIKELRIENCSKVTEVGLDAIAKNCRNIEGLMFDNCSLTVLETQ
ncbi:uncharacterized protein isoform X2 [Leptinotarsa decemlineata]|uniref:uncharacterized protein isoform X2 n=1 Tax=Leptinotarsa decemlineata TaxID=7539 RepID=UPI003D30CB32